MIRKSRGGNTKVDAKKDVVKSKTISGKKVVGATILVLVALFAFGAINAYGDAAIAEEKAAEAQQLQVDRQIDSLYEQSKRLQKKAHRWTHKRGVHKYHSNLSPKTDNLDYEKARTNKWKVIARKEYKQYITFVTKRRHEVIRCTRAGFPRSLCPAIIRGATLEGKKQWAFDSNLAWIVRHESGFQPCVRNGGLIDCNYQGNRAYGLFQFLGSTWGGVGCRITSDATQQTRCGIRYVSRRYGSPAGAVSFWRANSWY